MIARRYLDVIPAAEAVPFKVEVGDGERDACPLMYGDGPDTEAVVWVRVRIVRRRQYTLLGRERLATCYTTHAASQLSANTANQ